MSSSATSSCNKRKRGERGDDVVDLSADVPVETFEDAPDPIHIYNSADIQVNDAVRNIQREYNGARDKKREPLEIF
jgi:hypothetical protein